MLDTSQWPQIKLDVLSEVHLDLKNVRLEIADAKVEADIVEDLFANEDALGLVEGICKVGYLTHETPVVLRRRGKYVMVEGNRRLAALKAIQNPMLVPDYQARIAAFAALLPDRSALSTVRVMIAPNQTEADQLIAAIHTGNLRKAWSPSRQAAFFQAQIDAGRKLDELLARYPTIDVRKFVFRAHIINIFKSVRYDDAELQDFLSTKKWMRGLSTLARIYESKEFLELTGLTMEPDGNITKSVSDSAFKEIATAIVRGMFDENINTRSLNSVSSPRYTQLMNELRRIVADTSEPAQPAEPVATEPSGDAGTRKTSTGGSSPTSPGTSPSPGTSTGSTSGASGRAGARTPRKTAAVKKTKIKHLDLSQIKAPDNYPLALKLLLGELSEINVQKFPNATFLMIRAILEKSIKSYAEAKTIDIKATGNNQNGRVQLGQALKWLLEHVRVNGPTHLIQVIERVRGGRLVNFNYTNSNDALNALNHNHHFMVDADEVNSMWDSIDSIIKFAMKP